MSCYVISMTFVEDEKDRLDMKNNGLISIIVPVYNTGRYLSECLDSIINQTYRNIEIILINDGSTDDSALICDEYALKDSRVKVIHQENCGVSLSRDRGISLAGGDYLMFVDSDDWIDDNMCEALMDAVIKYDVEASICTYVREYPDRSLVKTLHSNDTVFTGNTFRRRVCGPINEELRYPENLESYSSMWGKLYPTKVLKRYKFCDIKLIGSSEDSLYNFEVFLNIGSIVYINKALYHYRKRGSSSISTTYRPNLSNQWDNLYDMMYNSIVASETDDVCSVALKNRRALNVLGLGLNCIRDDSGHFEKMKRLRSILGSPERREALRQLSLIHMPIHWKVFYFSAKHRMILILYILLIAIRKLEGKI